MTRVHLITTLLIAAITLLTLSPQAARADHESYCYTGECYDFDGETHLIESLEHMDRAVLADCERTRLLSTLAAKREIFLASRELCNPSARRATWTALRSLNAYLATRDICDMDDAALAITRALDLEGALHASPVLAVVPDVVIAPRPSYCYAGECFGFHGENHVIRAMELMDVAFAADCPRDRNRAARAARDEVWRAKSDFRNHHARDDLQRAGRKLRHYGESGRLADLDEAAGLLTHALELERAVHTRSIHIERGRVVGGYRQLGVSRPSTAGVTFGSDRLRFRISF